jgi:nucleotide-binding universal stress UspA family protein
MDDAPILICYDASEPARHAITAAAALLGPRRTVVLEIGPPLTPVAPAADFEGLDADDALDRARRGATRARQAGFAATPRGEAAAPTWEGITDVADEIDAAVIVMGSRGLNGGRERLEGIVSHDVARHAGRPVLIVPSPHGSH